MRQAEMTRSTRTTLTTPTPTTATYETPLPPLARTLLALSDRILVFLFLHLLIQYSRPSSCLLHYPRSRLRIAFEKERSTWGCKVVLLHWNERSRPFWSVCIECILRFLWLKFFSLSSRTLVDSCRIVSMRS